MLIWPLAAILEKNKLANDKPFIILFKMTIEGVADPIYLARNNEDIVWDGKTWIAYPMTIGDIHTDGKTLPTVNWGVSNLGGILQQYVHKFKGFTDAKVTIYAIHYSMLHINKPLIKLDFEINKTSYGEEWIQFTIGASPEAASKFPACTYMAHYCPYRFKSCRCGYTGDEAPCNNTLETCRIPTRFGGEEGMNSNGI